MGLLDIASGNSVWRGIDYFNNNKVLKYNKINEAEYDGIVIGSKKKKYNVYLNIEHPRSLKHNCSHEKDKKLFVNILWHFILTYFLKKLINS